jgi:hypothetical protein
MDDYDEVDTDLFEDNWVFDGYDWVKDTDVDRQSQQPGKRA